MNSIQAWLDGKKTHIASLGVVVTSFLSLADGSITLGQFIMAALGAFGLSALRFGIKKGR